MTIVSLISPSVVPIVKRGAAERAPMQAVTSLAEVRDVLDARAAADPSEPASLDLIGHSVGPARLLELGATVIDLFEPAIARFFAQLAADALLARAGLTSMRLLGCQTATTPAALRSMWRLARTLGVPVFGARKMLTASHYDARGFDPTFAFLLVRATPAPRPPARA